MGDRKRLKEDSYPVDAQGRPDLRYFRDPLGYYIAMHEQAQPAHPDYDPQLEFPRRVAATWGLIAKRAASAPYAARLLRHPNSEARADGAGILAEIGAQEATVDAVLLAFAAEPDTEVRDTLIQALGRMRNKRAIPALAAIVRDDSADGDTRWTAIESLGRIVRKNFLKEADPIIAARAWLDKNAR